MTKVKITVSVDHDLVDYIRSTGRAVSSVVNDALGAEIDRQARMADLDRLLDQWDTADGPVPAEVLAEVDAIIEDAKTGMAAKEQTVHFPAKAG